MGDIRGHRVRPQSRRSIRHSAKVARETFGLGGKAVDGERLLNQLVLYGVTYDVIGNDCALQLGGVEAMWCPELMTMYIVDETYDKLATEDARALFTVCHEVGHMILMHQVPQVLHRSAMPTVPHKIFEDSEWQADTFAAEFCMPLDIIQAEQLRTSEAIRTRFGVSSQAATVRLSSLLKSGDIRL